MHEPRSHAAHGQNFYSWGGAASRGATLIGYRSTIKSNWYQGERAPHHFSNKVECHRFDAGGEHGHHGGDDALAHDFPAAITSTRPSLNPLGAALLGA